MKATQQFGLIPKQTNKHIVWQVGGSRNSWKRCQKELLLYSQDCLLRERPVLSVSLSQHRGASCVFLLLPDPPQPLFSSGMAVISVRSLLRPPPRGEERTLLNLMPSEAMAHLRHPLPLLSSPRWLALVVWLHLRRQRQPRTKMPGDPRSDKMLGIETGETMSPRI